jgi:3'(2'), 5'-bisphosphate nucleotidase
MATNEDHALAAKLAADAGALLVTLRAQLDSQGVSGTELKDQGDQQSHDYLTQQLATARPDDAVLSEEGSDDDQAVAVRLGAKRVWIIDPLDGTREFGEPPRSDWAVHVALVEGGVPTAGAVALPALGLTLSTADAPVVPPPAQGLPRIIASRTRPGPAAERLAEVLPGQVIHMGSAGAKAMAVVRGEADIYAHTGGQYEWDSCAPVAVALAAGFHATRIDGSPLVYNNEDPYLPDLLICRPEFAQAAIDAVRAAGI